MHSYVLDKERSKPISFFTMMFAFGLALMFPVTALADSNSFQPASNAGSDLTKQINKFNKVLTDPLSLAGAVVLALGVITLIMAFSEQNMQSKTKGSLMTVGGIVLICIKSIYDSFGIKQGVKSVKLLTNVLSSIGKAMAFVGAILAIYALIQIILAYVNLNGEEKSNGLKALGTAIAFLCGSSIMKAIVTRYKNQSNGKSYLKYAIKIVIGRPATYIGAGLLTYGLIQIIMGFKNEDPEAKHQGSMVTLAGIGLVCVWPIFKKITGIW